MKERAPEVLYGEYEPCLRAMGGEREAGEGGRRREVERERERTVLGVVFGTVVDWGRRRDRRSRAVMR
jgi:hypothetical protein